MARMSEYVLRAYIRRGELLAFKRAKHVYLDPADLMVVAEIDWQHPPAELEEAVLHSLRRRLVTLLAGRSGQRAPADAVDRLSAAVGLAARPARALVPHRR